MSRFLSISIAILISIAAAAQSSRISSMTSAVSSNSNNANGQQEEDDDTPQKPKIIVVKDQGISVGVDIAPLIMRIIDDDRVGIGFVGRYGFANRWYANAELGYENANYSNKDFSYKSNGSYIRIGADYDLFESEDFPTNDNIFVGMRYCYAWQSHESEYFRIVDSYWGDYEGSIGNSSVNSHSLDILFGLRCEVLRNIYFGWTFRGRFMLHSAHDDVLALYAVAGYGKYVNQVTLRFTYTVEYQLPFNRKKKQALK